MKKMVFDVQAIRRDFPILKRRVNGRQLAYLDNAATTQKPAQVISAISDFYYNHNASVHRALHTLGEESTEIYEGARKKISQFMGSSDPAQVIFTHNATEALNLVKHSFALPKARGAKIISTVMEHHSNLLPWQSLRSAGAQVVFVGFTKEWELDYAALEKELESNNVLLVAVTHASNTLGTINDVKKIARMAHSAGAKILVDGAQSVPHMQVDVLELDCDFLAFSGHKMLGPTGIGVLYAKRGLLEEMPPFLLGGEMISEVSLEGASWNELPWKFEAGTPNTGGAVGLAAAVDYLQVIGMPSVREHELQLNKYVLEVLDAMPDVEIYGPLDPSKRSGLVSFNMEGAHPHDVATVFDSEGIAVRSGHNCAQPLITRLGIEQNSVLRASFYVYNTVEEIDRLAGAMGKAREIFCS